VRGQRPSRRTAALDSSVRVETFSPAGTTRWIVPVSVTSGCRARSAGVFRPSKMPISSAASGSGSARWMACARRTRSANSAASSGLPLPRLRIVARAPLRRASTPGGA